MKFNKHTYTWTKACNTAQHNWEFVGPKGGITFHAAEYDNVGPSCGLEIHHMEPPSYMSDTAPHHVNCHLIGGRCWHDGTSLYAVETLWPIIRDYLEVGDHARIFKILEREYESRFEEE